MVRTTRAFGKWIGAALGALAAFVPSAGARAQCALLCENDPPLWLSVAALLSPEVGVAVKTSQTPRARVALSWSGQIPLERGLRHRMVPSIDLLPQDGAWWRLRVGYRYSGRYLFVGAGFSGNTSGADLSPEAGIKFMHSGHGGEVTDLSMHLVARAEIAPETGHVSGFTILLGGNVF